MLGLRFWSIYVAFYGGGCKGALPQYNKTKDPIGGDGALAERVGDDTILSSSILPEFPLPVQFPLLEERLLLETLLGCLSPVSLPQVFLALQEFLPGLPPE